ncbi:MAG TPA: hypothetical protein VGK49_02865 [Ilumatobacteraceae bacterium]
MKAMQPLERLSDEVDAVWPAPVGTRHPDSTAARHWEELRSTGLLWLINATVFHPRGYALGLQRNLVTGEIIGWALEGDGTEPWAFTDEGRPHDQPTIDDLFRAAKELMP